MSEGNVLKLDIDSLTDFQRKLYNTVNPNDKKDKVNSRFSCIISKYGWSVHTKAKMVHTAEDGEVIYTASKKFDVIFKSEININLFPIRVKDKWKSQIQICYGHNLGHNIAYQGEVKIDDDHHQTIDSVWLDIHSQLYMKQGAGFREHYNRMVGNLPCLEEWSGELPGIRLPVPQPYYYSKNTRMGLKTLQSSMNTVTHHYKIRNKIHEILRMRCRNPSAPGIGGQNGNDEWQEIPCNLKYLVLPAKEFPIPELWARYALMTDQEREWFKFDKASGRNGTATTNGTTKHKTWIEDVMMFTSNNPIPLGSTDIIPLPCKVPCKAVFWVAQDAKSIENRNFSNYTTNSENLFNGWNPCSKVDIKYGGTARLEKLSHEHFELSEPWDFFPSAPAEPGYNAWTLGYEMTSLNADTAIVLGKMNASLHIKLGDTNPFNTIEDDNSDDDDLIPIETLQKDNKNKYIIHVRALVSKKMTMEWNEKERCLKYLIKDDSTK